MLCQRAPFKEPARLWHPDASAALGFPEVPTPEQLDPSQLKPCPAEAKAPAEAAACAKHIAEWIFATYCELVRQRLSIYNRYRQRLNSESKPSPLTLGLYRHACRLACEQILRRDLPCIPILEWNFFHPILPVCDILFEVVRGNDPTKDDYEIVKQASIQATIEVRQHNEVTQFSMNTTTNSQPEWSSSSSSSSSSSFIPG